MGSRSAFIVLPRVGEPGSPGPCRREGRRRVERTIDGKHGEGHEPYKPVHETAMDSQAEEAVRMLARSASDKGDERMIDSYGHPRLQSAKLSCEEPDAGNLHVRVCGGRGWQHPRLPGPRHPGARHRSRVYPRSALLIAQVGNSRLACPSRLPG